MRLQHIQALYDQLGYPPVSGLERESVDDLESELGKPFPAVFREFLEWAGHDSTDLFAPTDHPYRAAPLTVNYLPTLNGIDENYFPEVITAVLKARLAAVQLPQPDVLVFLDRFDAHPARQVAEFYSVLTTGDDPPVFRHRPGQGREQVSPSFSAWLEALVQKLLDDQAVLNARYGLLKPFRETHYLDEAKALYAELFDEPLFGCTQEEILQLEKQHGFAFPDALREFLLWAGQDANFVAGGGHLNASRYQDNHHWARKSFLIDQMDSLLPEDAVVFYAEAGTKCCYIRASLGEEALCFWYNEGEPPEQLLTLADWLMDELNWYRSDEAAGK